MEEWKSIEEFPNYEVSSLGNVKNIITGKVLKLSKRGNYYSIGLVNKYKIRKSIKVHRLVAEAFIENPENKKEVNHKDKNGLNNNVYNIEWLTHQENCIHRSKGVKLNNNRNIPVNRISLITNDIIEKYISMEDAAKWVVNNKLTKNINSAKSGICCAVKKINNSLYGFKWEKITQENFENEEWKEIIFENNEKTNNYISSLGRFKNTKGIIMENYKIHPSGYIYVKINCIKYALHRLVALMFVSNLNNKPFVNHIDGNKINNNFKNLVWVTCAENNIHNHTMGFIKYYTIKIIQYDLAMNKIKDFNSIVEASKELNIGKSNISSTLREKQKTAGGFIFKYSN